MSSNLGYLFYRCAYREEDGQYLRETDILDKNIVNSLKDERPTLAELSGAVFPYQPRFVPKPTSQTEEQSPSQSVGEVDLSLLAAKFNGRNNRRAQKVQTNNVKDEQKAYNQRLKDAEKEAKEINEIFSFDLKIEYPGLYAGLGYAHGLSGNNDDIKTGFSFDYTTGLPYIPGSSLKGTLRSCFLNHTEDVLAEMNGLSKDELKALELALFGPRNGDDDNACGCLICYDVFPNLISQGHALTDFDNITPHLDPLSPPNPIKTLRLRPGVSLRFLFSLPHDFSFHTASGQTIQRKEISSLFKTLLIDWGIGAKTNVGYGNLSLPTIIKQ